MPFSTPFIAAGSSETQRNTELVLYLLRLLEHQRDPRERIWPGDRRLQTLQSTCQVLEACQELNLKGLTQHLIEPAANWLLDLPLDLPTEDLRSFRLFPSRFKVLAQLGKFDPARLNPDFSALSQLFDPATGWIHDAPFDMHPTVVTLVWIDALSHLDTAGLLAPEQRAARDQALAAVHTALGAWVAANATTNEPGAPRAGTLPNSGDASYALALLLRGGLLKPDAPLVDAATQLLLAALRDRPAGSHRRAEPLYAALHLLARHPQPAGPRDAAKDLIDEFFQRYESGDAQHESLPIHALRARLLLAYHGEALRTGILEKLWQDTLAASEAEQRHEQAEMEAEFVDLIRHSIRVQLSPPQRITGTRARGEVYRLRFGLTTESTDERGAPLSTPRDTLRLIVKKGPPHVLAESVKRYHNLPDPLQRLFARHADLEAEMGPGYLIMQDLAEMQPLSEVLAQLDRPVVLAEERHKAVSEVAGSVADILHGLHGFDRRPSLIDHQLDVVYLAPMALALERLAQPLAFPELQQWLDTPPLVNGHDYQPLEHYLHAIRRERARLEPRSLGYLHGDCHSRNIMLTRDLSEARFVDIETLTTAQDYVVDYGLLLEDVAIYQSLPYASERGRVSWDEIATGPTDHDPDAPQDWLDYPAFPRSEAVVGFQQELLRHMQAFAEALDDPNWQPRLWLATARGLLLLASRQLSSHAVAPRRATGPRFVNDARLVQLAFAEALRLLHELAEHLDPVLAAPLPAVPFPGEQSAPPEASAAVAALMSALAEALGDDAERRAVNGQPQLADYVTRPGERLFARLLAADARPVLYLAGQPEDFVDPEHLAQKLAPGDTAVAPPGLATRLRPDGPQTMPQLLSLVRQARELAGRDGLSMPELPIPVGFRAETLQQVTRLLRSGESCAVVGVGSSGKSNVARHLARADVRQEYFGAEADATLLVYLNCKPLARRAPHELFLNALDQTARAAGEHTSALRAEQPAIEALWQAAAAQPESLARRNLDLALSRLEAAGAQHLALVLDDCDDLFALAAPVLFSDLRGLRDNHKPRLVYATFTRREPAFLRENTPEFEELFELLSAPGHTIPVAPYVEADGRLMLQRLAARQAPPRSLGEAEAQRLYQLAGGHAGLLRAIFFATQFDPVLAADALSAEQWTRLAEHADVEGESGKILDSLEPEERADLALAARGQTPSADGARRLERRGLLRLRLGGQYEIFSPLFERVLLRQAGVSAPDPATAAEAPAEPAVEFVGIGRQVRVNGALVTLLAPEFEILRCLAAAQPEPCSRLKLIEAMRLAEQTERSEKIAGDPLRRLHEYIRQLKARLGPAGGLIQPSGEGYRMAHSARPA